MKCPYNNIVNQITKFTYDYMPDGNVSEYKQTFFQNGVFQECLKEDCAAWYNGHCNYGVVK